jgi:hypothetical protein
MKNVSESNELEVLDKAFQNAWSNLTPNDPIPIIFNSKEMKLYFIEAYKALYAKSGGDGEFMRHWFNSFNKEFGDKPYSLCCTEAGTLTIRDYFKVKNNF